MLRSKLQADYTESVNKDEEIVFSGYDFVFYAAYYPSATLVYATAVDQADSQNYLVKIDWNALTRTLYPLKGLSEDPNATSYSGNAHYQAIIYAELSESGNFPVRGYIVGGAKTIWSYNGVCSSANFGVTGNTYNRLFISPESNKLIGMVSRIDLDNSSCKIEEVNAIVDSSWASGEGRDDLDGQVLPSSYSN